MGILYKNIKSIFYLLKSPLYPVNTLFTQISILGPSFSYYTLMSLMLFIKPLPMFMILLSTKSVIRRLIDLWLQIELTSNLEFDLQHAVD